MRATEFIQRCLAAGMPLDMALTAAKAFEAECGIAVEQILEVRREKERARQAKHRAMKAGTGNANNVPSRDTTSNDVTTVSERDLTRTGAQVVIPSLPSLRSEELVVGGGVGERERVRQTDDWPDGKASDHAEQLLAIVASPWLDPCKSPDLVTTRGRVAAWKRDGASWEHDVLPVVTGLCANRRARISSWKFFDAAIARSIAENRQALEIPEAGRVVPLRPGGESFADRNAADIAEARRRVLES